MSAIKKLLTWILVLIVAAIALLAAADNSEAVALKFLDWESTALPVSWWMLAAFIIGVLFGLVLNLVSNTRLRLNARRANKEAAGRTRELDQMKATPAE